MSDTTQNLASSLTIARTQKGLTIADLSKRSGVPSFAITRLEHGEGNPTLDVLERLAEALEVNLTVLFSEPRED